MAGDEVRGTGGEALDRESDNFFARLQFEASGTVKYARESWQRPKRHNRRLERAALWYALGLDADCEEALQPYRSELLLPVGTDVSNRYEIQAAVRSIHGVFPYSPVTRDLLRKGSSGNPHFEVEDAIARPECFDRWHSWLWMDGHDNPQSSIEALGASAILAEACARLSNVLPKLLDSEAS